MATPVPRDFRLTLTAQLDSADTEPLFDGTRIVQLTGIKTVRRLCRAVESELNCACSVVLVHDGCVLSNATGGLERLASSSALVVRRGEKRQRDLRTARPTPDERGAQPVFPRFLDPAAASMVPVVTAAAGNSKSAAKRRSVDFLLAGESVKRNRHLARFAASPYLPALLADPTLDGLWRRKGGSLRKELIEAYVVIEALEQHVLQQRSRNKTSGPLHETKLQATPGNGVVIDLCSGKGFLSVIVGYEFPQAIVCSPIKLISSLA